MTTTFYPVGTWNDPEGRYVSDYTNMSFGNPGVQTRTQFTTGYAGHQPDIKYKYGYGSVGPERKPRILAEVEPNAELPDPWERHSMRETELQAKLAGSKPLTRTQSVPEYARSRHKSTALNHIFPRPAHTLKGEVPRCPPAFAMKNPTALVNDSRPALRSTTSLAFPRPVGNTGCIDYTEPLTHPLPQGVAGAGGTGYDACAGIVNTWWPKEKPEFMRQTFDDFVKYKYSTSTARTYKPPVFHRTGNPQ